MDCFCFPNLRTSRNAFLQSLRLPARRAGGAGVICYLVSSFAPFSDELP
jgi:hypothetical protein